MATTRRDFLKASLATGSLFSIGATVPTFLNSTAHAAPQVNQANARDTILVVVQLTGGNDGLNTVIPFRDDNYRRFRPTLRQNANQVRRINDDLGLHPSMSGFGELLNDGALAIVQGVGYPNPTQSHFRSMDIWQAASMEDELNEGWIGKALRNIPGANSFHLANSNESAPLALTGAPVRVPSISTLSDFQLRVNGLGRQDTQRQRSLIESLPAVANNGNNSPRNSLLDFVSRTSVNTYASSRRLQEVGQNYQPAVPYPGTQLGNHLRLAAQLIDGGIGARLFYVSIGGFDTHAGQAGAHANLLSQISEGITAFYRDMAQKGHQNRVMVMTFSEFGRRVRENGSQGTDHGTAAPMFLVGGRIRSGVIGEHPSLTDLEAGNLRHGIDFRQVYAEILDQWLGVSSRQVLGERFEPVRILRG